MSPASYEPTPGVTAEWLAQLWWGDWIRAWRMIWLAEEQWALLYQPFIKEP